MNGNTNMKEFIYFILIVLSPVIVSWLICVSIIILVFITAKTRQYLTNRQF
jgi:hypothetical protein